MLAVSDRLRMAIALRQKKQSWLAEQLGRTQPTISFWVLGKRDIKIEDANNLAKLLDVNPIWLVHGQGDIFIAEK